MLLMLMSSNLLVAALFALALALVAVSQVVLRLLRLRQVRLVAPPQAKMGWRWLVGVGHLVEIGDQPTTAIPSGGGRG